MPALRFPLMIPSTSTYTMSEALYASAAKYLKEQIPEHYHAVRLAVICGSGLGGLVNTIEQSTKIEFAYADIPGFVASTGKTTLGSRVRPLHSLLTRMVQWRAIPASLCLDSWEISARRLSSWSAASICTRATPYRSAPSLSVS